LFTIAYATLAVVCRDGGLQPAKATPAPKRKILRLAERSANAAECVPGSAPRWTLRLAWGAWTGESRYE
jgi:hypothetical protein